MSDDLLPRCERPTLMQRACDYALSLAGRTIAGLVLLIATTLLVQTGTLDSIVQAVLTFLGL
jgi:hypothetical protein